MSVTPEQQNENKRVAQQIIDVWDGNNLDALDEIIAEDVILDASPKQMRGRDAYKDNLRMFRSAFPDMSFEANEVVAEGDTVVVNYTARGTHEGELMNIEPTGISAEVSGFVLYRFDDGTVVEVTNLFDLLGLFQQLGVVEPPGE